MTVWWTEVPTRLGTFYVAAREGKVIRSSLPGTTQDEFLASFGRRGEPVVHNPDMKPLPLASKELQAWASGELQEFSVPLNPRGPEFYKIVWEELQRIPYGKTATYGDIAERIGKPKASRAVGQANNRNPVAPFVPCHRVTAAGGKLGGYGGGVELKTRMLEMEGALRELV